MMKYWWHDKQAKRVFYLLLPSIIILSTSTNDMSCFTFM
jgi:hypothetical protein